MSSHPGSTMKEAVKLAEYIRDMGTSDRLKAVFADVKNGIVTDRSLKQDFYPTPSTISTCMYYTGVDPRDMKPVYIPKNPHEKAMQRALIQYRDPKNYDLVMEALQKSGRMDLVGYGRQCLIRPRRQGEKQDSDQRLRRQAAGHKSNQRQSASGNDGKHRKKKTIRNIHDKKTKRN